MNRVSITALLLLNVIFFSSCALLQNNDMDHHQTVLDTAQKKYQLGIIGEVENIYLDKFSKPLEARIDTGAKTSSIDAKNIKATERDGQKWVRFEIINPENKERHILNLKVQRITKIKKIKENDQRYVVKLRFRMGNHYISREFTLTDRSGLQYPVLIGRNVLAGKAIVDVAKKKTLN